MQKSIWRFQAGKHREMFQVKGYQLQAMPLCRRGKDGVDDIQPVAGTVLIKPSGGQFGGFVIDIEDVPIQEQAIEKPAFMLV